MTFGQAVFVVLAVAVIVLGLISYHLLSRLDLLEHAVNGGLRAPSGRLERNDYEQRFRRALARARLARQVDTGLVIVLGSESSALTNDGAGPRETLHEVAAGLANLARGDGIVVISEDPAIAGSLSHLGGIRTLDPERDLDTELGSDLGCTVTPFAFVVDTSKIVAARPVTSAEDLMALLSAHT